MEEGFPGRLETFVTYRLIENNSLEVQYEASTNRHTILNLTQHSYFNLSGDFSNAILDDLVLINADGYVPINENLIPMGEIEPVAGTPFDFRKHKAIGEEIDVKHVQLEIAKGYDHTWVLNGQESELRYSASAVHPQSGRQLEVYTKEPGMQFYTGNFLDGTLLRPNSEGYYEKRSGFCFETQHFPDSPNQENFPPVVLAPGQTYSSKTIFKFSIKS